MTCDCIERKEAELQERTGDNEAFIDAYYNLKEGERRFSTKGFYRKKYLGKFFGKGLSFAYIPFDYCPFCGKKYAEGVKVKTVKIILKRDKATMEADFQKGLEYSAFIARNGVIYLQDNYGEKVYLKSRDYSEVPHA
jgi:hypothetical protein